MSCSNLPNFQISLGLMAGDDCLSSIGVVATGKIAIRDLLGTAVPVHTSVLASCAISKRPLARPWRVRLGWNRIGSFAYVEVKATRPSSAAFIGRMGQCRLFCATWIEEGHLVVRVDAARSAQPPHFGVVIPMPPKPPEELNRAG